MQDGEVGVVRRLVDQPLQQGAGDPLQGGLPLVCGAQLVGGDAEPVATLLGQVGDEALLAQHGQQVVGRRAGEAEGAADRPGGEGLGMPCEQAQDLKGLSGGRCVAHGGSVARAQGSQRYRRSGRPVVP